MESTVMNLLLIKPFFSESVECPALMIVAVLKMLCIVLIVYNFRISSPVLYVFKGLLINILMNEF